MAFFPPSKTESNSPLTTQLRFHPPVPSANGRIAKSDSHRRLHDKVAIVIDFTKIQSCGLLRDYLDQITWEQWIMMSESHGIFMRQGKETGS